MIYFQLLDLITRCKEACQYFAVVENEKIFRIVLQKWSELNDLMLVLKIPFDFTIYMQTSTITLSDTFGRWLQMEKVDLRRIIEGSGPKSNFANILLQKLQQRKSMIMNTPFLLASVYLDPRYRSELTDLEIKLAKETLYTWYIKIHTLELGAVVQEDPTVNYDDNQNTANGIDSFEEYFISKGLNGLDEEPSQETSLHDGVLDAAQFSLVLEKYEETHKRIHYKRNILDYWNENQNETILFKLACFIHSIPPTQVNVERGFSILGIILNSRRLRLAQETLQDIISIRLNEELWKEFKQEEMENISDPNRVNF